MIQDIAPHRLDNQYHPRLPKPTDRVLLYRRGLVYMREEGEVPTVADLCAQDRIQLQYLFAVDGQA